MEKVKLSIIAVGDPIIDMSAPMDRNMIQRYNLEYSQTVFVNDSNKKCLEEIERNPNVKYIAGGALQNSLKVCAWALNLCSLKKQYETEGKKQYPKCSMLGCIGNDIHGKKLEKCLIDLGITPLFEIHPTLPTSSCGVLICDRERTLLTNLQASKRLSMDFIRDNIEQIEEHEVLALEGYFIKEKYDICCFLVDKFYKKNKKIILTLSATFMIRNYFNEMKKMADYSDVIFCNYTEAKEFSKTNSDNIEDIMFNIHKLLLPKEGRIIVCTNGDKGAYVSKFNDTDEILDVLLHIPAKKIPISEIVDFNAAGDAFAGGFIAGLFRKLPLEECAKIGNTASSKIIRVSGSDFNNERNFDY